MKYLVIYREDATKAAAVPPPILIEAVEATSSWLGEIKKSGRATEAMFLAGSHGGFAIFDAKNGGELAGMIDSCPARMICSVETHALMTAEEAAPVIAKTKQGIGEMMQKMAKLHLPK